MAKQIMERKASDNAYLHRDFHGALSAGIEYLHTKHGEQAVRDYLRQFTNSFYAPLKEDVRKRGLAAIKEHFQKVYEQEGGRVGFTLSDDELVMKVEACPAVTHMRQHGYAVAQLFFETTRTVCETLCEDTPFHAQLLEYDQETGRSVVRFRRRRS